MQLKEQKIIIPQGPHCLAVTCPHSPLPCSLRLVAQHLPHCRPGTTLPWCDEILQFFSAIFYQQEKEEISLSAPNPWAASWKSSFQLKPSMANSRCFSTSCSLAARLVSRALSAGIIFDSTLIYCDWAAPSVLRFSVPSVSTASFIMLLQLHAQLSGQQTF